jgi:hypothetical protein
VAYNDRWRMDKFPSVETPSHPTEQRKYKVPTLTKMNTMPVAVFETNAALGKAAAAEFAEITKRAAAERGDDGGGLPPARDQRADLLSLEGEVRRAGPVGRAAPEEPRGREPAVLSV